MVAAVTLVTAGLVVAYAEWQLHRINKVHLHDIVRPGQSAQSRQPQVPRGSEGPPFTMLVVGSDTRAALTQPGDARFGSAQAVGGARSDTIILVRVVPATHQVALLSVPRDLWVPVPGLGHQRINAAINSGPDLLIRVLHDQLGVDINHYVDVDFDSFRQIADAVGGIQVYFPTKVRDQYSNLSVPAPGCYHLAGDQALAFVRSRDYEYFQNGEYHQEALSDLARIQRQQIFIRKLVKKAESAGLTDPLKLDGVISGVTNNLTVDSSFSVSDMVNLARVFHSVDPASILGTTLATSEDTLGSGADVLLPDLAQDRAQMAQFLALGSNRPDSTRSPGPHSTTAPAATTTTTTSATVAPSSIQVAVVNGAGVEGQAGRAATALRNLGFTVSSVSTAPTPNPDATTVGYGAGGEAAAATVAAHIGGATTVVADSSLSPSTVQVVTGGTFTGITSSTQPISSPTSTGSPSGPAPSTTTSTTYVLPGTPARQPPPACGS